MTVDFYEFLGVPRTATPEQINKAFRERALQLHPDRNKDNPAAMQQFKFLNHAYLILGNPAQRMKYDETLPPLPEAPAPAPAPVATAPVAPPVDLRNDIHALWRAAGEAFFEQEERYTKAIDGIRAAVPIILDEDILVVGIEARLSSLLGFLNSADTLIKLRRILSKLTGRSLDVRVINGVSLEEWRSIKDAEERVRQRRSGVAPARPAGGDSPQQTTAANGFAPPAASIDDLLERMMRQWQEFEAHGLPQVRARFALEQLAQLARAEEAARAAGTPEDQVQKSAGKAIERLSSVVGIESGVLGLEYHRTRMRLLGGI